MSLREYLFHEEPGVTLYCGDAREVAALLPLDMAVVSDPPYGMDYDTNGARFTLGGRSLPPVIGDDAPFDPLPWKRYPFCVLWGFNHFPGGLDAGGALIWLKRSDAAFGQFLSDAEVAWVKGSQGVYALRETRHAIAAKREHPTEKPVDLMSWSIEHSKAPPEIVVLDPFAGSGTTLQAAKLLRRQVIGIELEPRYCEIAVKRLRQEILL